jgi:hypothetical protein
MLSALRALRAFLWPVKIISWLARRNNQSTEHLDMQTRMFMRNSATSFPVALKLLPFDTRLELQ